MASIGPVSMSTGSTPTRQVSTMRAMGVRPSCVGLLAGHHQHGGGAVGDLRRVAGGVHAVLAGDGLEVGQHLEAGLAQALVARRRGGWCRWACASSSRSGASTSTIWVAKRSSAQAWAASCWERRPNSSASARVMPHLSAMRSAPSNWVVNSYWPK